MLTFATPEPISVSVELGVGNVRIVASDRTDTVVEVRATDAANKSDVTAAEDVRVEYSSGRLLIKAAKRWRHYSFRAGGESIDVQIELPAGSQVRGEGGIVTLRSTGRLGEFRFRTGIGEIRLDQVGPAQLSTGIGDITVERISDRAEVTARSGRVQIARVDGAAVIKNSNGDSWIGEVTGDLQVNAANGTISVDQAHGAVAAKTANGDVRLGEVTRGAVLAQTGNGRLDVAVRDGVAAWLDLDAKFGHVDNRLDDGQRPGPGEETVEVRARSSFGDITIRRAAVHEGVAGGRA
jgi:DUF4097 and DUF4098 domain-containing protein YvlB